VQALEDDEEEGSDVTHYFYNFESREKKDQMTFKDRVLLEKYCLLEKENMIRIVLGLNYLLYGKEFNIPEKQEVK
jgi:hypothetical protein